MSKPKTYEANVIVTSTWSGTVSAASPTKAEDAARQAFDEGELQQTMEDILHVDVREAVKTFDVSYALEQGFVVRIDARSADKAIEIVEQQLDDEQGVLDGSRSVHFDAIVVDSQEVTP